MNSISVVIPCYNEERLIGKAIEQFQTLEGSWNIIVSDGGSSDKTKAIVESYKYVKFIQNKCKYRAQAIQRGIDEVKTSAMVILHADCQLPNNAYQLIKSALSDDHAAGAFRIRTQQDLSKSKLMKFLLKLADYRSIYSSMPYGDQAVFFKMHVFNLLNGYPQEAFMDDWEFSRRLKKKFGRLKILKDKVEVSGRRMENSPLKYVLIINFFPLLNLLGFSKKWLASFYSVER